jgi:acetyl-CoA carboxylase carboxyl transferase subunit beta
MQEGMVALVQMAKTAEARRRHARAGLGQVTLLASPTTGGVYASFASLGDVLLAEPEALVAFAGPRVVKDLTGAAPRRAHTAEFAYAHGLVDTVVPRSEHVAAMGRALRGLQRSASGRRAAATPRSSPLRVSTLTAWQRVQLVRDLARPKARTILDALLEDATELRGDRAGADDDAVVVRLGSLRGARVVAVGQDASGEGRIAAAGFRKAVRGIELAGRLGLPLVTIIDTRGADPGAESEGGGLAAAIAATFVAMLDCSSPTVAVVTGEGGSGGALSMAPADRVLALEHAVFSVIAPEGAASILHRDASRAPDLAGRLGITTPELVELGIVDRVLAEPEGGLQAAPDAALDALGTALAQEVAALRAAPAPSRLGNRRRRWRRAGNVWLRPV